MIKIETLQSSDKDLIRDLLLESDLPVEDIDHAFIKFYGIKEKGEIIGVGALEIYDKDAILRSRAVKAKYRQKRLGTKLTAFLEESAKKEGINQLYLLTTTAKSFFTHLAYHKIARSQCPVSILNGTEFKFICTASATCMKKKI